MKPLPAAAQVLEVKDLLVTDMTFEGVRYSREHEHERPFVGVVLDGSFEKWLGTLSFGISTWGAYVMPAGVKHVDAFPMGIRLLTLELAPETETWEHCAKLLDRVRRIRGPELATVARQLAVELRVEDDVRPLAVEGLSLELVAAAMRSLNGSNGRPKAPAWLNTVDEFLTANFFQPLRIADIANVVHVHPAHLARVFRTHHGESIGHRIRRLRLDWAIGQLAEGERPLREIAAQAGFAHQSHFSRAFKDYTGWPPARYRERLRTKHAA
jgi:AraC family transcriptional regulator